MKLANEQQTDQIMDIAAKIRSALAATKRICIISMTINSGRSSFYADPSYTLQQGAQQTRWADMPAFLDNSFKTLKKAEQYSLKIRTGF